VSEAPIGRTFVIFNPASGRGRGRERTDRYLELLGRHLPAFEHAVTRHAGEEADLADRALDDGFETIVAVGGDGTWSQVADRLAASESDVRLGLLPSGTGNDFGRNLDLDHRDMEGAVRALASGRTRRVDVGLVHTPCRPDGRPEEQPRPRHFLNVVGFGFDVAVVDAAAGARFLRGELLYKITALQQLFRFPGFDVSMEDGEGFSTEGEHLMVTLSNGRFFGGGFPIAPGATVEDGALHACLISDASPLTRARLFNMAERGRHVGSPRVELRSARRFRATFPEPPRFEVDGDIYATPSLTLEAEVLPAHLQVVG
jgi:diacylglycerol kinase (ATP)